MALAASPHFSSGLVCLVWSGLSGLVLCKVGASDGSMAGVKGFRCELSENNSQGSGRKFLWDFLVPFWVTNVVRMIQTGSYLANKAKMSTTNQSVKSSLYLSS